MFVAPFMQKLFGQTFAHGIRSFPTQRILFCYLFSILATIYGYCRNKDKSSGNPSSFQCCTKILCTLQIYIKKSLFLCFRLGCHMCFSSCMKNDIIPFTQLRYLLCHVHGIVILWQQTYSSNLIYSFQKRMHVVTQEPGGPCK